MLWVLLAESDLHSVGVNLFSSGVALVLGLVASRAIMVISGRRLWQLSDPERVIVCVSESGAAQTGRYRRPATGIGQVRALAVVAPSLQRAYRKLDLSNVRLSTDQLADNREIDLISLGGGKNNEVTKDILECLSAKIGLPAGSQGSAITWAAADGLIAYEAETEDGAVKTDYGLIVRAGSPFRSGRSVVVLAGASTFGTTAAARFFVEHCRSIRGPFAAIVKAPVRDRHALEPEQVVLARYSEANGTWR
jgi:hypothetical protein